MKNEINLEDINRLFYAELGPIGRVSFSYTPVYAYDNSSSVVVSWILPDKKIYTQSFASTLFNKYLTLDITDIVNEFIKPTCAKFKLQRKMDKENNE